MKKVLLLSLLVTNAFAVTGIGEYRYGPDTTENQACEFAEEKAKEDGLLYGLSRGTSKNQGIS